MMGHWEGRNHWEGRICDPSKHLKWNCLQKCGALRDFVPFVQFKKREKCPWRSVVFRKSNAPPWCFSRFLNCAHCTKSRNAPQIVSSLG